MTCILNRVCNSSLYRLQQVAAALDATNPDAGLLRQETMISIDCRRRVANLVNLLLLFLVLASYETPLPHVLGSNSSFSLARELAHGTSSLIVVPGNHTVAREFDEKGEPLQLTRWGQNTDWLGFCLEQHQQVQFTHHCTLESSQVLCRYAVGSRTYNLASNCIVGLYV
jgi:hypothetical protein